MHEPIVLHQRFGISCARLFELLSTPAHMEAWFSPADDIPVKVLQHAFEVSGTYALQYTQPDGSPVVVAGKFVQIEEPSIISFTWEWQQGDEHASIPTLVTWLLKEQNGGCELTVIHERLPDQDYFARHQNGWLGALQRLRNASEGLP